ncbi:MAG: NAD(P)-dependent oxidoreductase [Pseudomonadota bacterium]
MAEKKVLITGTMGCIGAWVLRHLIDDGTPLVAADLSDDRARPRLLMSEDELDALTWVRLDVTDTDATRRVVADHGVTHIIHLAGLQIPFCRANPPLGAAVNVLGTVNIFEAARHEGVKGLAYASSLAALSPVSHYSEFPLADSVSRTPATLYGVYKVANEETARIYHQDWGISSVGLRPYTVYGVGRDQGVTADVAKAILAAAAGQPFHMRFSGPTALQHASDVARIFIACAEAELDGAPTLNLRGDVMEMADIAALINKTVPGAETTVAADAPLPLPADLDDAGLRGLIGDIPHMPMVSAIEGDVAAYRALMAKGLIDMTQLER